MARLHLTDLAIRKLPNSDKGQVKYWDTQTAGFGVLVGKRAKTYFAAFGKDRQIKTIARFGEISLSDARKEAMRVITAKHRKTRPTRLPALVTTFLDDCETRLRPTSVQRYRDVLDKAPDTALDDVKKDIATTAHEIKAYKALFNFAIREELYDRNPFQHVTATYGKRSRVLTDAELKTIWEYDDAPFTDMIKLLLVTGQRKNQVWKLDPKWVRADTIVFPPSIMKGNAEHTIPYGDFAASLLEKAPFSFNGWSKCKARMDKETGVGDWKIHDLRRTFATIHARIGTPIHVVEALLAHTSGQISGVTAVYIRHDWMKEMREAVQKYENHLQSLFGVKQ